MQHSYSTFATLVLAFAATTHAHVKIETPVPYGAGNGAPALDTNPLLASGTDFPCKQRPEVYKLVKNNVMAIGQPQPLTFQGQATHGGGSCQISLSKDKNPTKDSVWKVILSIQGGCPSKNPGNVGESPFGYGADKFQYTIPPEISPGDYTLAFTWFNKIGDREMYMNCAPITVTSSGKRDLENGTILELDDNTFDKRSEGYDSLPDMFVANIGNGCSTAPSGTDLAIPEANLGKYTMRINTGPLTPPIGNCGGNKKVAGSAQPAGSAIQSSAVQPSASAAQPSIATPVAQPTPHTILVQPSPSTAAAQPTGVPQVQPTPATPAAGSTPAQQAPSAAKTGSCSTPGKSVCSDDLKFWGDCLPSHTVNFEPVAPGTKCDPALGVLVPIKRRSDIQERRVEHSQKCRFGQVEIVHRGAKNDFPRTVCADAEGNPLHLPKGWVVKGHHD